MKYGGVYSQPVSKQSWLESRSCSRHDIADDDMLPAVVTSSAALSQCLYSGVNIDRWAVLSFVSQGMQGAVVRFASQLAKTCNEMGMVRAKPPEVYVVLSDDALVLLKSALC